MGYSQDKTGLVYIMDDDDVKLHGARNTVIHAFIMITWLCKTTGIENDKLLQYNTTNIIQRFQTSSTTNSHLSTNK